MAESFIPECSVCYRECRKGDAYLTCCVCFTVQCMENVECVGAKGMWCPCSGCWLSVCEECIEGGSPGMHKECIYCYRGWCPDCAHKAGPSTLCEGCGLPMCGKCAAGEELSCPNCGAGQCKTCMVNPKCCQKKEKDKKEDKKGARPKREPLARKCKGGARKPLARKCKGGARP